LIRKQEESAEADTQDMQRKHSEEINLPRVYYTSCFKCRKRKDESFRQIRLGLPFSFSLFKYFYATVNFIINISEAFSTRAAQKITPKSRI
jgi:hypothetical protein